MKVQSIVCLFVLFCFSPEGVTQEELTSYQIEIEEYRKSYLAEFSNSEHSPVAKEDLKFIQFFEGKEEMKVMCEFERTDEEKPFKIPTYNGKTHDYIKFGNLYFELEGQKFQLSVYQILWMQRIPGNQNHLFVPFKDFTNGESTYGGGRYIDLSILDLHNNKIELDFNKCYNPYCAYSDGYSCPIPPPENHLSIDINAGEKDFLTPKQKD